MKGFYQPIYQSLTQPILLMGVPRTLAYANGALAGAFFFGFKSFLVLPFNIAFHMIAAYITKKDPYAFSISMQYFQLKKFYRP